MEGGRKDGEKFVVNIFSKFKLITEDRRKAVAREAEIMRCIKHPSIIRIVDSFETKESIHIVMEYFSLTSLR